MLFQTANRIWSASNIEILVADSGPQQIARIERRNDTVHILLLWIYMSPKTSTHVYFIDGLNGLERKKGLRLV